MEAAEGLMAADSGRPKSVDITVESAPSPSPRPNSPEPSTNNTKNEGAAERAAKKAKTDRPKPVFRRRTSRLLHGWLAHLPALAMTCVLIFISHSRLYWYPEDGPEGVGISPVVISNLLQGAAKFHEIMIVASLAALALAMFRRRLVTRGVRLGFLTGGYRVGDLGLLTGRPFWHQGSFASLSLWDLILAGFVLFSTIMSTVVGPASAILVLPSLGWYDLHGAFANVQMPLRYSYRTAAAWPGWLDARVLEKEIDCMSGKAIYLAECPAGGFGQLHSWISGLRHTELQDVVMFQDQSMELGRQLHMTESMSENMTDDAPGRNTSASATLVTAPSNFAVRSLALFAKYLGGNNVGAISDTARYRLATNTLLLQPFVQTSCAVYDRGELQEKNGSARFPIEPINCFGENTCLSEKTAERAYAASVWDGEENDHKMITYMLETPADTEVDGHAVPLFAGILPYVANGTQQRKWVFACNALARYVPASLAIDAQGSEIVQSNISSPQAMRDLYNSSGEGVPGRVIYFTDLWLNLLDPSYNMTKSFSGDNDTIVVEDVNTNPILEMIRLFRYNRNLTGLTHLTIGDESDKTEVERFLSRFFGAILTDGISRASSDGFTMLVFEDTDTLQHWKDLDVQRGVLDSEHRTEADGIDEPATFYFGDSDPVQANSTMREIREADREKVAFDFDVQRYGYGTGQPSRTQQFALVVMCLYLAAIFAYAAVVTWSTTMEMLDFRLGERRLGLPSVVAWSDLQDLVLLALRSSPPQDDDLHNIGAGCSKDDVWKKVVRVQADGENSLHLVVGSREGMVSPVKTEAYS